MFSYVNFFVIKYFTDRKLHLTNNLFFQIDIFVKYCKIIIKYFNFFNRSIHVVDRRGGGNSHELIHSNNVPMDIRVWNPTRQPEKPTPCDKNNGGCSDLCLLSPNYPGYSCACPTGIKLIDHHNCAEG